MTSRIISGFLVRIDNSDFPFALFYIAIVCLNVVPLLLDLGSRCTSSRNGGLCPEMLSHPLNGLGRVVHVFGHGEPPHIAHGRCQEVNERLQTSKPGHEGSTNVT